MGKHTETPWVFADTDDCTHCRFFDKELGETVQMSFDDQAFATHTANCHDALVDALASPTWLVWSNEHRAWWGPNHRLYFWDINAAGRYTLEEALKICTMRGVEHGDGINPPELIQPSPEWLQARTAALAKVKGGA